MNDNHDMPKLPQEPEKVEPFKNALESIRQTPEQLRKFQKELIMKGFRKLSITSQSNRAANTSIFEHPVNCEVALEYFDNLNSFYVNTASAQWCKGIFEMLEDIREQSSIMGITDFSFWVRKRINEEQQKSQTNYKIAQENCEILQKRLGL